MGRDPHHPPPRGPRAGGPANVDDSALPRPPPPAADDRAGRNRARRGRGHLQPPSDNGGHVMKNLDTAPPTAELSVQAADEEAAIEVLDLSKTYPGDVRAVRGVTFRVRPGEVFGLLGPNGAGKSTTVGMLTTTIEPTEGTA